MNNLHVLKIFYLGATNTLGSRVKIQSERFKQKVTIPYDYKFNCITDIAINYLQSKNFVVIGKGEGDGCMYIITETFEPLY